MTSWSDYTIDSAEWKRIGEIGENLDKILIAPPLFHTLEQIENLTIDQALDCIKAARRMLLMTLLHTETHEHWLDDCGDDMQAATENWEYLHNLYFSNDLDEAIVIQGVKKWLDPRERNKEDDALGLGGVDGEIRFTILADELLNIHYDEVDRKYKEWKANQQREDNE